jgi:tRNA pseudouridine55 synthase
VSRRGATGLRGILLVDKPAGLTSHDVVARVRRITGEGRVGHAGTLDPLATGLLVVLVGPYTRLEPYLSAAEKAYQARITFGAETDTDDSEGAVVRTAPVPAACHDPSYAASLLTGLIGPSLQSPPAFSAIKVAGRVAHKAARAGDPLELADRPIEVFEATVRSVDAENDSWDVSFRVSKGTYVRALARDIGRACGSAAHLTALRRTSSGHLRLSDAHTLEEIATAGSEGRIESLFTDPLSALGLPVVESDERATAHGSGIGLPGGLAVDEGAPVAVTISGRFVGLYVVAGERLLPAAVMPAVAAS